MTTILDPVQRIKAMTNLARRFGAFLRWQFDIRRERVLTTARSVAPERPTPTDTGATRKFTPQADLAAVCAFLEVARACDIGFDCNPMELVESYKGFRSWLANSQNLPEFVSNRHKKGMGNRVDADSYLDMVALRHAIDEQILELGEKYKVSKQTADEQKAQLEELITKNAGK